MATNSYWIDSAPFADQPKLTRSLDVDVIVIGGGIVGITAAFLAKRAGKTVAPLERSRCATVDTGHTTAHLTAVTDLRLQQIPAPITIAPAVRCMTFMRVGCRKNARCSSA
ncbi:MAG TPA: FAD-dependent oxidoreductase [Opitutus sp.]|nr:FAD-dependent oxidoreductase [Opitutus sp.]